MIEQRAEFVALALQPGANRRELCRRFRISPDTAYRWLGRFAGEGPEGLQDRSRRPHRSPGRTAPAVEAAVLALRAQYPGWGGRKLRVLLAREGVAPLRCGPGRCHPLTVLDDHSRYALVLAACPNQRTGTVRAHLEAAFRHYGLPDRFLLDNGSPWGDTWPARYTPLTVWLRRYGVAVSHSRPYHPQTLGKDERFHGTLQRELLAQPPRPDLAAWHAAFAAWRQRYNHVRPHNSLDDAVPASRYLPQPARLRGPAALALWPRRSGPQGPGRRPGRLPGPPASAAQGPARLLRGLPPHPHRRLLGRVLHDRAPAHDRSAGLA